MKSAVFSDDWIRDDKDEVVLIGRSNVGKSSLINALAKRVIARASKTPGRTRTINFYDFGPYRLVDLPGYGYSSMGRDEQDRMAAMITDFLTNRTNLRAAFLVVDSGVVTRDDFAMVRSIERRYARPFVIANKSDKLTASQKAKAVLAVAAFLAVDPGSVLLVSAKDNVQIDAVRSAIIRACAI